MSGTLQKNTWRKQSGFILSLLGSAVGFGNILSFSAVCYRNGGGAFLIPYFAALFILGIPMLLLEGLIGNKWKEPLASSYGRVLGRPGRTFGWLAVLACATIGAFYIVLTGYAFAYTYFAAFQKIPHDTGTFFKEEFIRVSSSLTDWGLFSWPVFLATCVVSIFSWFVLIRNVRDGIEKICTLFMPFLGALIILFAASVAFLPGGMEGWRYYLTPNFSKLMDANLWRDVFGQLLFSLSLGLGIIVGYSRHTDEKIDIGKSMICVALGDFVISFIAGAAIFGCIAHMSHVSGIPFEEIVKDASTFEIGFIIFPKILAQFSPYLAVVLGVGFFACLFLKGSAGVFSIVESVAGNLEVEFGMTRKKAVTYTILFITLLAGFFCFGNSPYLIDALAPMVLGTNMLLGSLVIIFCFLWKCKAIKVSYVWHKNPMRKTFLASLMYVVPILLIGILGGNIWQEITNPTLSVIVSWGWFFMACSLAYMASRFTERRILHDAPVYI
jgi:neurotransmitter:Na+ symporter, NSS family